MKSRYVLMIFSLIYIAFAFFISRYGLNDMYENIISYHKSNNQNVLSDAVERFKSLPQEDIENAEKIDKIFEGENAEGFVYKDNSVIYETNLEITKKYKNSNIRKLYSDYSRESGDLVAENISNMFINEEGTEFLRKQSVNGREMLSWKNVDMYGNTYVVGVSSLISNMLIESDFFLYRNMFWLYTVFSYGIFLIFYLILIRTTKKSGV